MVKSVLITLIGLAFVALGVFLLVRGDPADAALAWGVIAFFGACAAVGLVQLLPVRRARLDRDGALVVRQLEPIGLSLAGIGMGAGCFFLAPYAAAQGEVIMTYVAYFGAAFFGGGSLLALGRTLTAPPLARIDASGVEMFGAFGWKLAWREIVAIHAETFGGDRGFFDFVTVHEPAAASERDPADEDWDEDLEHEQEPSNRRTLSLVGTRLAFEDVRIIVDELWRRHRGH
ncbi:MAG: hypothetical protein K2P70_10115 [Hyphomonadaceae bacterium]|nr:hypothetical protein [Hyphomonadaceae bacterium]